MMCKKQTHSLLSNSANALLATVTMNALSLSTPITADAAVGTLPEYADSKAVLQGITVNVADKSQQAEMIAFLESGFSMKKLYQPFQMIGNLQYLPLISMEVMHRCAFVTIVRQQMHTISREMKDALDNIPTGDVVIVAPKRSNGTIINGMLVEKSARDSRLESGGSRSGGVISCLINGPKDPNTLAVVDGGYSTSTVLWYGL
eukprot:scaffold2196_cov259-Chaetoceros_neogracile.AAC.1